MDSTYEKVGRFKEFLKKKKKFHLKQGEKASKTQMLTWGGKE